MQILKPQPRPAESETLGIGPSHLYFNRPSRWFLMHAKGWEPRLWNKVAYKISKKALFQISKKGSESSSKLQQFDFASWAGRNLLPPPHSLWLVCAQLRKDILRPSRSLSRGLWVGRVSASGQKPCPWLPFGTKSLASGIAKLSVGVSKKPILSVDALFHTSPEKQPDKCLWEQADTKGAQLHSSQISLHRWIWLWVLLVYLNVHLLSTAPRLWNHTSLDGAGGPSCLILST